MCNMTCDGMVPSVCGNGILEIGEICDEGIEINGTTNHCNLTCDGMVPSVCGNGILEIGEMCDD